MAEPPTIAATAGALGLTPSFGALPNTLMDLALRYIHPARTRKTREAVGFVEPSLLPERSLGMYVPPTTVLIQRGQEATTLPHELTHRLLRGDKELYKLLPFSEAARERAERGLGGQGYQDYQYPSEFLAHLVARENQTLHMGLEENEALYHTLRSAVETRQGREAARLLDAYRGMK